MKNNLISLSWETLENTQRANCVDALELSIYGAWKRKCCVDPLVLLGEHSTETMQLTKMCTHTIVRFSFRGSGVVSSHVQAADRFCV